MKKQYNGKSVKSVSFEIDTLNKVYVFMDESGLENFSRAVNKLIVERDRLKTDNKLLNKELSQKKMELKYVMKVRDQYFLDLKELQGELEEEK